MENLASTYRNQGRWKEAEELAVLVMETRKRLLGESIPHRSPAWPTSRPCAWDQGRLKEAEELEVVVMEFAEAGAW